MLDLLLSEISDPVVRENFFRLSEFVKGQTILEGQWEFYQVEFTAAVSNFKFRHNLKFVPVDIIVLSVVGDQNAYFRNENFTREHIDISVAGPCRIRFLAGRYESRSLSNREFTFSPISGGGGGGSISQILSSNAALTVTNPTGPNVTLGLDESQIQAASAEKVIYTYTSTVVISALKLVTAVTASTVKIADPTSFTDAQVLGVAINSVGAGASVNVQSFGEFSDASFNFPVNDPLFLGSLGQITNIAPTSGHRVQIGYSMGVGKVFLNITQPIKL